MITFFKRLVGWLIADVETSARLSAVDRELGSQLDRWDGVR